MSSAVNVENEIKREDLNACTIKLDIKVSPTQVKSGFDKAIKNLGKKANVPGFRKGAAPKAIVEKMLNPQAMYEEALEVIVKRAYEGAIKSEEIEPNGMPMIDVQKIEREPGECEFSAKIPLKPIIELAEYKGLKGEKPAITVTDDEVDAQIEEFRRRAGEKKEVTDRGAMTGDMAVVNVKADGEDGDGKSFMVVVGQTFPGLDKILEGANIDDTKKATLDFPENFQNPDWAGKKVKATVSVKSINAVQMPELDDAFAAGFQADDVADLKEKVKLGIEQAKSNMSSEVLRDQLLDQVLNKSKVEVADNTWEQVIARRKQEIEQEAKQQNMSMEDYIKANGQDMDTFEKQLREDAILNVRRAVVIDKIFQDNKMEVGNEDVGIHLSAIAQENQVPRDQFESFVKQYGPQLREEVVFRTMATKVAELLVAEADITEVSADATAAPKKAAPKKKAASKAKSADGEAKADGDEKPKKKAKATPKKKSE